jgi:hypothetical protein
VVSVVVPSLLKAIEANTPASTNLNSDYDQDIVNLTLIDFCDLEK